MPNGWIRCTSFPCSLSRIDTAMDRIYSADVMNAYHRRIYSTDTSSWLAQANAIFNRLKITWDLENFGIFPVSPGSSAIVHFFQSQWMASSATFNFLDLQTIYLPATSFYPHWPSLRQMLRQRCELSIGQRIGLSTHLDLADSGMRQQMTWDFRPSTWKWMSLENHGMLASTMGFANFRNAKVLILTARKSP